MENLRELAHVVSRNSPKHLDILSLNASKPSKVNRFYQAIESGEIRSDEDALGLLYPEASSKSAYNNLKVKLRAKLLNTLFFVDVNQSIHSDRQAVFFEVHKEYAAAQILLAKNAHSTAINLLVKVFKRCEYFEFSELALLIARMLRTHYGLRARDTKSYQYYAQKWESYREIVQLEEEAEKLYSELMLAFASKKEKTTQLAQRAEEGLRTLLPYLETITSYKFHFFLALIRLFGRTCTNDYPATLPITQSVISFFENKPYTANTPIQLCRRHQIVAYIQLEDYAKAAEAAEQSQALTESGTFNWFGNLEYLFLLAMHSKQFQRAYEWFTEAVSHKRFAFLPEYVQETWEIYRAYLHLMITLGKAEVPETDRNFSNFRIQRFLNSIPIYSKDKEGMNISILIVQILFYIQKKKYDQCIDRIETIEKYCSRYLMKPKTLRSYYFIKLLLAIPQASFHPVAVERYTKNYWQKLQQTSSEFSQQFHKIEIVPYELLWEIALGMLGHSSSRAKTKG